MGYTKTHGVVHTNNQFEVSKKRNIQNFIISANRTSFTATKINNLKNLTVKNNKPNIPVTSYKSRLLAHGVTLQIVGRSQRTVSLESSIFNLEV